MLTTIAAENPFGRLGRPEDVAETIAFLASDGAAYITRAMTERFAVLVGLPDRGGDPSPGSDGQWWSRHLKPPTFSMVGCSTVGSVKEPRSTRRCETM
jgi:hypothetical protein